MSAAGSDDATAARARRPAPAPSGGCVAGTTIWIGVRGNINGTPPDTDGYRWGLAEFQLTEGGSVLPSDGWIVTAPGSSFGGNVPQRAVDGSTTGSFITESMGDGGKLLIDVGADNLVDPDGCIFWDCNELPGFLPASVLIRKSVDGVTWTLARDQSNMVYSDRQCVLPLS